jgi:hypothetical protein
MRQWRLVGRGVDNPKPDAFRLTSAFGIGRRISRSDTLAASR